MARASQRGVSFEQITECITNPDQISDEPLGKMCYKKLQNDKQLLLCYTIETDGFIRIITVILTSKVEKYLRT